MDWFEVEELAIAVLGIHEDSDSDAIEQALADRFEVSGDQFKKIAEALIPFTVAAKSSITDNWYQGFAKHDEFIVKVEVR
ncbi:MAG: hypothetical protein LBI87_00945 [Candidatus Accumulibacter sp.]|jgi:hypothetical protein|nr:hypothetical protein [Accumulibacter sp.]